MAQTFGYVTRVAYSRQQIQLSVIKSLSSRRSASETSETTQNRIPPDRHELQL